MSGFGFDGRDFLTCGGGRGRALGVVGGRRRRCLRLDGLEHALADLLGVDLEDLDAVVVVVSGVDGGGGLGGGGGEGLFLDAAGGGGGVFGGHGAVALSEGGGCGEGFDHARDDGITSALGRRPDAQRHARDLLLFLPLMITTVIMILFLMLLQRFLFFCHCNSEKCLWPLG